MGHIKQIEGIDSTHKQQQQTSLRVLLQVVYKHKRPEKDLKKNYLYKKNSFLLSFCRTIY